MGEIEKKIGEAINFVLLFFKSLGYFITPQIIVKKIKSPTEVFPPLAFLAVLSFFGLKLWTYFFLSSYVDYQNQSLLASTEATLTHAKSLDVDNFLSIPGLEELFTLTIPYIFLVVILSKIIRLIIRKRKIEVETDLGDIVIYFCGFLVILFPLIFMIKEIPLFPGAENFKIYLLLSIPLYLYFMFATSFPKYVNRWKRIRFGILLSLTIPVCTLSFVYGSIYLSTHVQAFENSDLSSEAIDKYIQKELFEARIISQTAGKGDNEMHWQVLLRVSDEGAGEFIPCFHNLEGVVYGVKKYSGSDTSSSHYICTIRELFVESLTSACQKDIDSSHHAHDAANFTTETCLVKAKSNMLPDSGYFNDLYVSLNVIQTQQVSTQKVIINLWPTNSRLNQPIGKIAAIGTTLLKPKSNHRSQKER